MKWSRKLKKNRQNSNVRIVIPDPPEDVKPKKVKKTKSKVKELVEFKDEEVKEIDLDNPEENGVKIDAPKKSSDPE